ncbi:MAG: efflux RND transporter permease subunit [Spirochaetales bacterium]|nr:MAG: efflux RND transporter permease subunit [Spirochaetales bacterium]
MRSFLRTCIERPIALSMIATAVLLWGASSLVRLPVSRLPLIEVPRVLIEAAMPGLPAAEMRSLITVPLEEALASTSGLVSSNSISRDGRTLICLDFSWGTKPSSAVARVREILDLAYQALPQGASRPTALPYDPSAEALIVIAVEARNGDLALARHLAEYELRGRFRRLDGAGGVSIIGGCRTEISVAIDLQRASAQGLSIRDITRIVSMESVDVPAGTVEESELELVVVAEGRPATSMELNELIVAGSTGPFRLDDVAKIEERPGVRHSVFAADGHEAVGVELRARPGTDPLSLARCASDAIESMSADFSRDFSIRLVKDGSRPIAESIRYLGISAVLGAAAAAFALTAFLREWRTSLLVAATIPLSVAVSFGILSAFGRSLNAMSLGGLALSIGMVSDNAVVVLTALRAGEAGGEKLPGTTSMANSVSTVFAGTLGSTATTAIVFVPVLFLPGALGSLFGDLALALIGAVATGWLCAIFIVPGAYRMLWRPSTSVPSCRLETVYRRYLRMTLRRPAFLFGAAAILAVVGVAAGIGRPMSFLPPGSGNVVELRAVFPSGSDADRIAAFSAGLSGALAKIEGVCASFGWAGAEDDDLLRRARPDWEPEALLIECVLEKGADPVKVASVAIELAWELLPAGTQLGAGVPEDPAAMLLGLGNDSRIVIRGDDPHEARRNAEAFMAEISRVAGLGVGWINVAPGGTKPVVRVRPRREALSALGSTLAETAVTLREALQGSVVGTVESGGREQPIRIFASGALTADTIRLPDEARDVPVATGYGTFVPAGILVDFIRTEERAAYARLDGSDVVFLSPRTPAKDASAFENAYRGIETSWPRAARVESSAFAIYSGAMVATLVLVVVLLYLSLGAQFESFRMPFLVMASIPLALAGAGPALATRGMGLDSGSIMGLVVLFGVAVNNAIFFYEAATDRASRGLAAGPAAYAGASDRVRPVLATSLSTVMALMPIAFVPGNAAQNSMATAMLGGFVASTGLSLFVTPAILANASRERVRADRTGQKSGQS